MNLTPYIVMLYGIGIPGLIIGYRNSLFVTTAGAICVTSGSVLVFVEILVHVFGTG